MIEPALFTLKDVILIGGVLIGQIFTAGAIYGALKSELKHLRHADERHESSIKDAHERIDTIFRDGIAGAERRRR